MYGHLARIMPIQSSINCLRNNHLFHGCHFATTSHSRTRNSIGDKSLKERRFDRTRKDCPGIPPLIYHNYCQVVLLIISGIILNALPAHELLLCNLIFMRKKIPCSARSGQCMLVGIFEPTQPHPPGRPRRPHFMNFTRNMEGEWWSSEAGQCQYSIAIWE
jgi:hypothetical protein